jgi:Uma2 family endonuclease
MASLPKTYLTPKEFLAIDRKAQLKSEYFGGQAVAFAGASKEHNLIVANVIAAIHRQLIGRPCNVYPSDMRVGITRTGAYAYPDVVVTCGEEQFEDGMTDILLNPIVLIEVSSDSTVGRDRGEKFENYKRMDSLREYLLISQTPYRADLYVRQNDFQWLLTEIHDRDGIVDLSSINCRLTLRDIYAKVAQTDR